MIFYFSGTGNSLWVAKQLKAKYSDNIISIADELKKDASPLTYSLKENEKIFFVFPVHSWGPAVLVLSFINKLTFKNYTNQPVYTICTCGDNCGFTDKIIREALQKKSINLTHTYSLQMPNNYILMKGFGIDSKETEKEKLSQSPALLKNITDDIDLKGNHDIYTRGIHPFLKSRIVYPLFRKYAIGKNKFYATDECISCGLCESVCPTGTITLHDGKPLWGNNCVQCTACIHRCPVKAIEYGNITQSQGRYTHPDL